MDAERLSLEEMVDRFRRREGKALIVREFRHYVMIVGVEPFGHFHRGKAMPTGRRLVTGISTICGLTLIAARHGEIDIEWDLAVSPGVSCRNGADHGDCVEHVVIKREIVGRDFRHAAIVLLPPAGGTQRLRHREQVGSGRFSGPVVFKREFQFPPSTDTRHAERCYRNSLRDSHAIPRWLGRGTRNPRIGGTKPSYRDHQTPRPWTLFVVAGLLARGSKPPPVFPRPFASVTSMGLARR